MDMDAGKARVKDGGDTQSAANLENSEGQREGLPQGGEKGSFRGLE